MYFLVMYNLSPIQKGIQAGHAALEYAEKFGSTNEYQEFIKNHKTFIVLDGGASGNMVSHTKILDSYCIPYAHFIEPDLNNAISSIAVLAKECDYAPGSTTVLGEFLKQFNLAR